MNRFALIPYDLYDDLANGEISFPMFQAMVFLHKWADWATGTVRKVRAKRLEAAAGEEGFAARTFQRALKNLHNSGRITSHHIRGSKKWYEIDLNNYRALTGALKDTVLRPTELKDWRPLDNHGGADKGDEDGCEEYCDDGCDGATVLDSSRKSTQTSSQTSEQNSKQESPSLHSSPTVVAGEPAKKKTKTKPDVEDIAKETLVQLLEKLFETAYQPVHETQLPAMIRCFSNGTPPDELKHKMIRFADWMIERGFSSRIVSMKDFFHHWENAANHENGFRPQFDAFYRAETKIKATENLTELGVSRSAWDWICRAPACNRPWTEEVYEIKLCARCAAFPDHPAEAEVRWAHCQYDEQGQDFGDDNEVIHVKNIEVDEL